MRIILLVVLSLLFANCSNEKKSENTKKNSENITELKDELYSEIIQDTCENTKEIIKIFKRVIETNEIGFIDSAHFRRILAENNDYSEGCYFPLTNNDYSLLYQFTDQLKKIGLTNEFAIQLLIILSTNNTTNAEYSECFFDIYPEIAENNILLFVKALSAFNEEIRERIISDLGYISEMGKVVIIISKLNEIQDERLIPIVNEVKEFLSDEKNFDF
jgi:hypothetical protein